MQNLSTTPLLDLFTEVDPGDHLPADLGVETVEYIEKDDLISWEPAGTCEPRYGVILRTNPKSEYALIRFEFGALRWAHIDEIVLILKGTALALETKTAAFATV